MSYIVVVLVVLLLVLLLVLAKKMNLLPKEGSAERERTGELKDMPYEARPYLFSKAENSFYQVLRQAVGDKYVIFAKVRLGDVVDVRRGTSNRQRYWNRIQSKHVDFLLCDPKDFRPAVVIELDDSSHERADRQGRDEFVDAALKAAGLPCVRFPAARAYSTQDLLQKIAAAC